MACFPACSAWCVCDGNECIPTPVTINALRLRTPDGRYLGSSNVGQGLVVARNVGTPGFAETFLLVSPATGPLTSGSGIQLAIATSGWTRAASQILRRPQRHHDPSVRPQEPPARHLRGRRTRGARPRLPALLSWLPRLPRGRSPPSASSRSSSCRGPPRSPMGRRSTMAIGWCCASTQIAAGRSSGGSPLAPAAPRSMAMAPPSARRAPSSSSS